MEEASQNKNASFKESLDYVFKLISTALIIILLIVGAFLIYYVISSKIVSSKTGQKPKLSLYTIISGSMDPAIKVSDIILNVRVDDFSTLKVGDVITYESSNALIADMTITHRIIDIRMDENNNREFITKGDWNASADSNPIKESEIIGKTVLKIPSLGKVQILLASKLGWVFIVLIPALGIIIYDLLKLFKIVGVTTQAESISDVSDYLIIKEENKKIMETLEKIQNNKNATSVEELKKSVDLKKEASEKETSLEPQETAIKTSDEPKKEYTFFDNLVKEDKEEPKEIITDDKEEAIKSIDELKNLIKKNHDKNEIDTKDNS